MKAETRFIRQIQKMANDKEFQNKHVTNAAKDFKRTRKLTFSDVIMYTIGNTRSPLELDAKRFSKHLTTDEISGAALCKARQKIKYTAYEELFKQTAVTNVINLKQPLNGRQNVWKNRNYEGMSDLDGLEKDA